MTNMDESPDERPRTVQGDWPHLPGGYHEQWKPPVKKTTEQTVAEFAATNSDWREFVRGWNGL